MCLALQAQFFLRFVTGINAAIGLQFFDYDVVAVIAVFLVEAVIPSQAHPDHSVFHRLFVFQRRAFGVGVIHAQKKVPFVRAAKKPRDDGGARIADMEVAGGGRGETDADGHGYISLKLAYRDSGFPRLFQR